MEQTRVVVLGALPPPVVGAALANMATLDALEMAGVEVVGLNVASSTLVYNRGKRYHFDRFCKEFLATVKARRLGNRSSYFYTVPGAGLGMFYTLAHCLFTGRNFRGIVLHHHSCKYIAEKSLVMSLLVRLGGKRITHVFLTAGMATKFLGLYGQVKCRIVTNARFAAHQTIMTERPSGGPLKLGHLSNLCKEKGFFHVAAAFDEIRAAGVDAELLLAGPAITTEVSTRIEELRALHGSRVCHLGPVGPTQKDEFYKSIDLFLFPSQFAQEAAPLVLYEAQSAGVPCLASDRGVIAEMLGGDVWDEKSSFGNFVLEYISKNAWTPFAIADRAAALHARMRIEAETSKQQLNELVELLAHPAT